MDNNTSGPAVIDEAIWRAWVQKGRLRGKATIQKLKVVVAILICMIVLTGAIYLVGAR